MARKLRQKRKSKAGGGSFAENDEVKKTAAKDDGSKETKTKNQEVTTATDLERGSECENEDGEQENETAEKSDPNGNRPETQEHSDLDLETSEKNKGCHILSQLLTDNTSCGTPEKVPPTVDMSPGASPQPGKANLDPVKESGSESSKIEEEASVTSEESGKSAPISLCGNDESQKERRNESASSETQRKNPHLVELITQETSPLLSTTTGSKPTSDEPKQAGCVCTKKENCGGENYGGNLAVDAKGESKDKNITPERQDVPNKEVNMNLVNRKRKLEDNDTEGTVSTRLRRRSGETWAVKYEKDYVLTPLAKLSKDDATFLPPRDMDSQTTKEWEPRCGPPALSNRMSSFHPEEPEFQTRKRGNRPRFVGGITSPQNRTWKKKDFYGSSGAEVNDSKGVSTAALVVMQQKREEDAATREATVFSGAPSPFMDCDVCQVQTDSRRSTRSAPHFCCALE